MDVVFLKSFVHGRIRGVAGKSGTIPDADAQALAKAGLVRIVAEAPVVKKTPAGGAALPSSASPAAPASPPTTSSASDSGEQPSPKRRRRKKNAESS